MYSTFHVAKLIVLYETCLVLFTNPDFDWTVMHWTLCIRLAEKIVIDVYDWHSMLLPYMECKRYVGVFKTDWKSGLIEFHMQWTKNTYLKPLKTCFD